jgi:hypothetical protein
VINLHNVLVGINIGVFIIGVAIGRAIQRWCDNDVWCWEEEIFEKGRREGYREGYRDAKLGLSRRY